jgi:curved DNA-binding protein CbpA
MRHPGFRHNADDPYRVLGVDAGASRQDITRAYRRAAQRVHPDTRPEDPQAAARFQALADAYDLLRDPGRRADYDHTQQPDEPASRPAQPARADGSPHLPSSSHLGSPAAGQPIWAGPVHIDPPATGGQQGQRSGPAAARFQDPPAILESLPGSRWRRPR